MAGAFLFAQQIKQAGVDIIKAAVGKDRYHVTGQQRGLKVLQDVVGVCKGKGVNAPIFKVRGKLLG